MKRYIDIRSLDYWLGLYGFIGGPRSVEFDILRDRENRDLLFHFEIFNLDIMDDLIRSGDYIDQDEDQAYQKLLEGREALVRGEKSSIVSILHYPSRIYKEDISFRYFPDYEEGKILRAKNSLEVKPYYADIFVGERQPLLPYRLLRIMEDLVLELFGEKVDLEILKIPSYRAMEREFQRAYRL